MARRPRWRPKGTSRARAGRTRTAQRAYARSSRYTRASSHSVTGGMRNLQGGNGKAQPAPPSIREQTLQFLEMVAGAPEPANPFSLTAEFIRYQRSIRASLDPIYGPLDRFLTRARQDETVFVPQFLRLKTNTLYGSWKDVAELMHKEMDWKMPPGQKGLLHTSCRIEKVKDYCQYMRFRNMRAPLSVKMVRNSPSHVLPNKLISAPTVPACAIGGPKWADRAADRRR